MSPKPTTSSSTERSVGPAPRDRRWPRWVYGHGGEPDYRFSFANERTFLAWIRTALALLAAGVAVDVVDLDLDDSAQRGLAGLLVALGLVASVLAWFRWAGAERAMRRGGALPSFGLVAATTLCVTLLVAATILVGL